MIIPLQPDVQTPSSFPKWFLITRRFIRRFITVTNFVFVCRRKRKLERVWRFNLIRRCLWRHLPFEAHLLCRSRYHYQLYHTEVLKNPTVLRCQAQLQRDRIQWQSNIFHICTEINLIASYLFFICVSMETMLLDRAKKFIIGCIVRATFLFVF